MNIIKVSKMSSLTCAWVRKGPAISRLPRVKLNNIQDLPGAKKKVEINHPESINLCV